jgi:hypothetical protein
VETGCRGGQGSPRAVAPRKKKKKNFGGFRGDDSSHWGKGGGLAGRNTAYFDVLISNMSEK